MLKKDEKGKYFKYYFVWTENKKTLRDKIFTFL